MPKNLAVCVLGNRNSGKSYTWNTLFGEEARTGTKLRKLYLSDSEYVDVFLVSGSPEERKSYVGKIITVDQPRIVLCSLQYRESVIDTIKFFANNNYLLFIHWLNPGYNDLCQIPDRLGLVPRLLTYDSLVGIRNAQGNVRNRVREMREFIFGWAQSRNLIKQA